MSDQEAAEVADFIFSLFLKIAEKHHPLLTGKAGEGVGNPAFKRIDTIWRAETVQARLPGPSCLNGA